MKDLLTPVHIVDKYIINPTNKIRVNIIGAGGTGSHVLTAMARINHSLIALNHPGLQVAIFDKDTVGEPNLGRQLFTSAEIGMNKAICLVNRINRFFGTDWKAIPKMYDANLLQEGEQHLAGITISCVDTVKARFDIAEILKVQNAKNLPENIKPMYWMDFGNNQSCGQVILSTVGSIIQPKSAKFTPIGNLPFITDEFSELLISSEKEDNTPSCSLAEALDKQDLFINSTLANLGASLLWNVFRTGIIENRGFFINLKEFRTQPLKVA